VKGFWRVLAAQAVSHSGSMPGRLAIPRVATLALAAGPWQMVLLPVADAAAGTLFMGGPVGRGPEKNRGAA
jgi:hypothetical protein